MLKFNQTQKLVLASIIPIIQAGYLLYLNSIHNQSYLTRIDPEYLCLLNGLNIATFNFDNIGYTDLPGTPFLALTGILMRLTHLFAGQSDIMQDVILRPEFYLSVNSQLLLGISIVFFIWGGYKILKVTNNIFGAFALQSSFLLSPICFALQLRYNADRFLTLLIFIFSIYTIQYIYKKINSKKYATLSGIIMGIGFITKLNFIAVAIIPFLLLDKYKYKARYSVFFLIASFFSFLPIINKFNQVKDFFLKLVFNKGSYGGGEKGLLDVVQFISNLPTILTLNLSFIILIITSLLLAITYFTKNSQKNKRPILVIGTIIIAFIIEIILASKHYKNYYLAPVLSFSGILLFLNWNIIFSSQKSPRLIAKISGLLISALLIIPTIKDIQKRMSTQKTKQAARIETRNYINQNISNKDYLLLEPTWLAGPFIENGLVFGISYVAGRDEFSDLFITNYPNILTFEGENKPLKYFRTEEADIAKILLNKKPIYIFSTQGLHPQKLVNEIKRHAAQVNITLDVDTVFLNQENNDMFIKLLY